MQTKPALLETEFPLPVPVPAREKAGIHPLTQSKPNTENRNLQMQSKDEIGDVIGNSGTPRVEDKLDQVLPSLPSGAGPGSSTQHNSSVDKKQTRLEPVLSTSQNQEKIKPVTNMASNINPAHIEVN